MCIIPIIFIEKNIEQGYIYNICYGTIAFLYLPLTAEKLLFQQNKSFEIYVFA